MRKDTSNLFRIDEGLPRAFLRAWLVVLALLFCWLAVHGATRYHFSADELMHFDIARGATLQETLHLSTFEPHPPLGHILRHYWIQIGGDAPSFVRSQSLLFGVLTILLYYRMGAALRGGMAGALAAAFVAFAPSVIAQSFLVRNYAFFIFFLSLAFYYYLQWREARRPLWLWSYGISGLLACLAHFSGMFALAVIGAYEMLQLLRSGTRRTILHWILAHVLIAISLAPVWWALLPYGIAPFQAYARQYPLGDVTWMDYVSAYFYSIPRALLPYPREVGGLFALLGTAALLLFATRHDRALRPLLAMLGIALVLGLTLLLGGLYPFIGTRHLLWLLPFVCLSCGLALADGCAWVAGKLNDSRVLFPAMLLILSAGWASYDPAPRFMNFEEYQITEPEWQDFTHYLSGLNAKQLIVARRADAVLIDPPRQNPYRSMGKDDFIVTVVPYAHTQLLFDPTRATSWHYLGDLPFRMVREAEARGLLKGIDTLVFVNTNWTSRISRPMADLILCPALPKTLVSFPAHPPNTPVTPYKTPVTLLIVSKKTFFNRVLTPDKAIQACLTK